MKLLLVCATALGLIVTLPALAQNNDRHGDKRDASASNAGRAAPSRQNDKGRAAAPSNGRSMAQDTRTTPANRDMNNSPAAQPSRARDGATRPATPAAKAPSNRYLPNTGDVHETPPVRPAANKDRNNAGWSGNAQSRQPAFKQQQNRTGWSDKASGRRNDFGSMRHNMQATKRFNGGTYRSPQGYKYRHWSYGERLPRGYYVRNYWISDFVMFGLFAPPSELVWVRVGDDALLIDRESGDIVQVRYGVFY